jgi:signal transduction histidine kinase
MGHRLPVRAVRAGLPAAVVAAAASALLALAVYDFHAAWVTFALLAPLGCATVLVCAWVLQRRTGLRRQALLVGAVVAVQALATIGLFVAVMFVSSHDAFFTVLATAYCAGLALWAGWVLSRRVLGDVQAVEASLAAVGEGRRDVQIAVSGEDEVARLARQVEAMVDRLARSETARNDLVAAVSHDLRTPITSLRLLVEALDDDILDDADRSAYLAKLRTHVGALGALIDDLFELSRLQAGELRWSMERVPLPELVEETVEAMRRDDVAQLVVDVPGDLAPARAAPEQIQRVLFNLIQNAIRHTPADGSVTVRAAAAGEGVQVEVADTGSGIADGDRERVFEAFFQGGARAGGSAGLGLAISRAIVEAHGGRIWLEPRAGGTSVCFTLPGHQIVSKTAS